MKKHRVRPNPTLLAAALAGIAWGTAQAQTATPGAAGDGIQEVIVTAQRSAAPESKTPVAMSVLSGEQLGKLGLDDPMAIGARLPNTYLEYGYDGLRITIRGVSSADNTEKGDPSAAFMIDGVYVARPQSQTVPFFDVDRIEVLRGPQGTLYGRNTTAGVVHVISKAPVPYFEGEGYAEVGSYNSRKLGATVNVPAGESLALRAAVAANRRDPFLRNAQGTPYHLGMERDDWAARLSAKLDLDRALGGGSSLLLRYERMQNDASNDENLPDTNFYRRDAQGQPVWFDAPASARLTNAFIAPNMRPEQGYTHKTTSALSAELNWNLGPAILTYLGSHRDFSQTYLYNFYYRVMPTFAIGVRQDFDGDYNQDSHELRLATRTGGRLNAQGGFYWFREDARNHYYYRDLQVIGLTPWYVWDIVPSVSRSRAVFGQATYGVTDALRLTLGARYNQDGKSRVGSTGYQQARAFNPATDLRALVHGELATHKTTWRLGAELDVAPAGMLYGTVSTGFKAGGFNDGCVSGDEQLGLRCGPLSAMPASDLVYAPETVRATEAGFKTRFWQNRASLNLAAFHYDYRNLQLSAVAFHNGSPVYVTSNAGQAVVNGLEAEGQLRPAAADRLDYALTFTDAHYVRYSPDGVHSWAGVKLDRTPTRTLSLGWEHRFGLPGGALVAGVHTRASSRAMLTVPSQALRYWVPGHTESDLRLAWEPLGARWTVQARVRNLENEVRPTAVNSFGMALPSAPRTADLRFDYRF
jgi:iron complex outermembrane receptor protein